MKAVMKRVWIALLALAAAASGQQAPTATASIEGQVTDLSGHPVAGAQVTVASAEPRIWHATTTPAGTFRVEGLAAGDYLLQASLKGYLDISLGRLPDEGLTFYGGLSRTSVTLTAGQRRRDVTLKLTRAATLSGRVTGPDGNPLTDLPSGTRLALMWGPAVYTGFIPFAPIGVQPLKKDLQFTLSNLAPGRYFLIANVAGNASPVATPEVYVDTFFPGTARFEAASPLTVAEGANLQGLELRLQKEPVFHVRGTLLDQAGHPANGRIQLNQHVPGSAGCQRLRPPAARTPGPPPGIRPAPPPRPGSAGTGRRVAAAVRPEHAGRAGRAAALRGC